MTEDRTITARQMDALNALQPDAAIRATFAGDTLPHLALGLTRTEFAELKEWGLIHGEGIRWGITPAGIALRNAAEA